MIRLSHLSWLVAFLVAFVPASVEAQGSCRHTVKGDHWRNQGCWFITYEIRDGEIAGSWRQIMHCDVEPSNSGANSCDCEELPDEVASKTPACDCEDAEDEIEALNGKLQGLNEAESAQRKALAEAEQRRDAARDAIYGVDGSATDFFKSWISIASLGKGKVVEVGGYINDGVDAARDLTGTLGGKIADAIQGKTVSSGRRLMIRTAGRASRAVYDRCRKSYGPDYCARQATQSFMDLLKLPRAVDGMQEFADHLAWGTALVDYYENTQTLADHIQAYLEAKAEAESLEEQLEDIYAQIDEVVERIEQLRDQCGEGAASPVGTRGKHERSATYALDLRVPLVVLASMSRYQERPTRNADPLEQALARLQPLRDRLRAQIRFNALELWPPLSPFLVEVYKEMNPEVLQELLVIAAPLVEQAAETYVELGDEGRGISQLVERGGESSPAEM